MIKINLLPQQKRSKVSNVYKELVAFLCILVLLAAGAWFIQSKLNAKIEDLQAKKQQKQTIKRKLQSKMGKIRKLEKQLAEVNDKIAAIRKIRAKQGLPVRYIDVLVSRLPKEKIWFETLQLDNKGQLDLRGVALDNQAFAYYVETLRKSSYIQGVSLKRTSRKNIKGLGLVEFQCQIQAGKKKDQSNKDG
jgi:type IV pilus assembly protein PilN